MRIFLIFASLSLTMLFVAPASAQTMAELDRISDLSADEETGIEAARELADRGEYLEALATLERVMAVHPRSLSARLLHAVYLCRIDDRQGGLVEIDRMDEDDFGRDNLAQAREQCSRPYVEPPPPAPAVPPPPPVPAAGSVGNKVLPRDETRAAPVNSAPGVSGGGNSISGANRVGEEASNASGSSSAISSSSTMTPSNQLPPGSDGGEKD